MVRLDSDSFGTLEVECAKVVAIAKAPQTPAAGHASTVATFPSLPALQTDSIRGRGPDAQAPAQSGNPTTPVIRPALEEALRRAELLRNPDSPLVGSGRVRLTGGFDLGLAASAERRSQDLGVAQQVSYGWTNDLTIVAGATYAREVQEARTLTNFGETTTSNQARSSHSSYLVGASYRLNHPTAALPTFTVSGLVSASARAASTIDELSAGKGNRSAMIRLEAGREYDSVSWTAAIFATAYKSGTISEGKGRPGFSSGVDLFGGLMLNDRYSVFASLKFTDARPTMVDGIGLPGSDRKRLSTEYGFVSELSRGRYLTIRAGSALGAETNASSVGAALTLEY